MLCLEKRVPIDSGIVNFSLAKAVLGDPWQVARELEDMREEHSAFRNNSDCDDVAALYADRDSGDGCFDVEVLSASVGVLALMIVSLLFALATCWRRARKIHVMNPPDATKEAHLFPDKSHEKVDARAAELALREAATAALERKIVDLGARLLERALCEDLWEEPASAQALRDWAKAHSEVTAETVLEIALKRLDLQLGKEISLVARLQDLELRLLPELRHERGLEAEARRRLEAQAADTLAACARMQNRVEELQMELAEARRNCAEEHERRVALEAQAEEVRQLEERLASISQEHEALRSVADSVEHSRSAAVSEQLARRSQECEEHYVEVVRQLEERLALTEERLQVALHERERAMAAGAKMEQRAARYHQRLSEAAHARQLAAEPALWGPGLLRERGSHVAVGSTPQRREHKGSRHAIAEPSAAEAGGHRRSRDGGRRARDDLGRSVSAMVAGTGEMPTPLAGSRGIGGLLLESTLTPRSDLLQEPVVAHGASPPRELVVDTRQLRQAAHTTPRSGAVTPEAIG